MLGGEAEDHCRVWGKDHTPGKGGAELQEQGAELGRRGGGKLPEGRLEEHRAESILLSSSGRKEGKKEGRKEGREEGREGGREEGREEGKGKFHKEKERWMVVVPLT